MGSSHVLTTFPFSLRGERLVGQEMFKVMDRAQRMEQEGHHIYHLELGNPRMAPPPEIVAATVAAVQDMQLGYTPMAGLLELRSALATRYAGITGRPPRCAPRRHQPCESSDLSISRHHLRSGATALSLFTPAFPSSRAGPAIWGFKSLPYRWRSRRLSSHEGVPY